MTYSSFWRTEIKVFEKEGKWDKRREDQAQGEEGRRTERVVEI